MTTDQSPRSKPVRRLLVGWTARFGLLFASLCAALLLLLLLDPFLPGVDRPPDVQSEAFHHTRMPGVWVAEDYEWGPHFVYIDADGWREPSPVPVAARTAPRRFRMAVMGDSFVEAIQVPWEDTFVARLEARSAGRVEVLNRANVSYSPLLALLRWRRQVAGERPTHLLLVLYANDVAGDRMFTASALRTAQRRRRDGLGGDSTRASGEADDTTRLDVARLDVDRLFWREPPPRPWRLNEGRLDRLYRRWRGRAGAVRRSWRDSRVRDPDRPARRWRQENPALTPLTERYLGELAASVREAGVEFTLSAVPNTWEFRDPALRAPELRAGPTFADNVAAWAAANGVRYVDLQPAFRAAASDGQPLFFERDGHFTPAGHAVAAEVFAAAWPELFAPADPLSVRGPSGPLPP